MVIMASATLNDCQFVRHRHYCRPRVELQKFPRAKDCNIPRLSRGRAFSTDILKTSGNELKYFCLKPGNGNVVKKNKGINAVSTNVSLTQLELLDAWDDKYEGVIINPNCLPTSANSFVSALRSSLSYWKFQGKRGIWLKILLEQADLVPIAIQEGFNYHHCEPGYVMLTYWIPDEPCMLPDSPSHLIGVGGFVINDKREVLAVKEKCPCYCSTVWKMPTGFINKSEDIFSGAMREVKEETGVDTKFLKLVALRHAHLVAFEKSDLLFVCMLKPLSYNIRIDEKEIQAAKWMALEEFIEQPFYQEDHMSMRVIETCIAAYEDRYDGFTAHRLTSKLDGKLSYLYYDATTSILTPVGSTNY